MRTWETWDRSQDVDIRFLAEPTVKTRALPRPPLGYSDAEAEAVLQAFLRSQGYRGP